MLFMLVQDFLHRQDDGLVKGSYKGCVVGSLSSNDFTCGDFYAKQERCISFVPRIATAFCCLRRLLTKSLYLTLAIFQDCHVNHHASTHRITSHALLGMG